MDTTPMIDFSSPVAQRRIKTLPSTPLIPVPTAKNRISLSPTNNNPFDVVARQTITPDDPFECVLKNACNTSNEREQSLLKSDDSSLRDESNISKNKINDLELSLSPIKGVSLNSDVNSDEKPGLENCMQDQIINEAVLVKYEDSNPTQLKSTSKTPGKSDDSHISADFSTEEGLKAVIAKRVSKCIQKVLNNSVTTNANKDCEKKNAAEVKNNFNNRRSLSFVTSSNTNKKRERLNKSCTDTEIESFLEKQQLNVVDTLIDIDNSAAPTDEVTDLDDSVFKPDVEKNEKNDIFAEANKLAHTFKKISDSFTKNNGELSEDEDDDNLLTCQPQWLDSSEDEEEKLRKDPALNIRVSFTSTAGRTVADSPALAAFKNRQMSLSQLQPSKTQVEPLLKRSVSIGTKPAMVSAIANGVLPVPAMLVNPEEQLLKLKKKPVTEVRRGPLKAVMPIQIMTKEQTPPEVVGKPVKQTIREPSPVRKQNSIPVLDTPTKNHSRMGMLPVASSTPNKFMSATPQIDVPSNKRRSLGSTIESRKSRPTAHEDGSRQRSNSANIPAPVVSVKPFKAQPLLKHPLKPKSMSSLTRTPSPKSQMNAQHGLVADKKSVGVKEAKQSSRSRVLSDVKPHSPRLARVKTTMTAISSLVTGKGKKASVRGKENRVPA